MWAKTWQILGCSSKIETTAQPKSIHKMSRLLSNPAAQFISTSAISLALWGYSFELAYFFKIDVSVHETLKIKHFIFSSGAIIAPILALLFIYSRLKTFFTKDIYSDNVTEAINAIRSKSFKAAIPLARIGTALAILFLIIVVTISELEINIFIWPSFLFIAFLVLQLFFAALLSSPQYARATIVPVFIISIAICFAAGGYGYASSHKFSPPGIVRNDFVVTTTKVSDNKFEVKPKSIPISLSLLQQISK